MTSPAALRTLPDDPHAIPCPSCAAGRMEACVWRRKPRRMTVHAARSDLWMRTVRAQNDLAEWVEYPDLETPDALAARRATMHTRYCTRARVTRFILRRAGLQPAVVDCVRCDEGSNS